MIRRAVSVTFTTVILFAGLAAVVTPTIAALVFIFIAGSVIHDQMVKS